MRVAANATNTVSTNLSCPQCGKQNAPDMRFCGGCGYHLTGAAASPSDPYASSAPQYQQQQGASYQYPQQQPGYQQQPSYPQQQYMQQGGYQPQPMMGQQPMVLRCPTCMAMAPVGSVSCPGCRTSLAGVLPTPAGMQGQQQGGFLQGNNGKMAMGVLGGAAAVLGGEMLLHGVENGIENRVEGDMGYGGRHHHHHRRDDDRGPLGGLGELADDIGLF
ncbi:zinc ribbon domain-containing protein [Ktedonobacteria bacterium brp13]|nr:zinc ribbon domain-containing protein [Ktedonobacteria bacterium brp13]